MLSKAFLADGMSPNRVFESISKYALSGSNYNKLIGLTTFSGIVSQSIDTNHILEHTEKSEDKTVQNPFASSTPLVLDCSSMSVGVDGFDENVGVLVPGWVAHRNRSQSHTFRFLLRVYYTVQAFRSPQLDYTL